MPPMGLDHHETSRQCRAPLHHVGAYPGGIQHGYQHTHGFGHGFGHGRPTPRRKQPGSRSRSRLVHQLHHTRNSHVSSWTDSALLRIHTLAYTPARCLAHAFVPSIIQHATRFSPHPNCCLSPSSPHRASSVVQVPLSFHTDLRKIARGMWLNSNRSGSQSQYRFHSSHIMCPGSTSKWQRVRPIVTIASYSTDSDAISFSSHSHSHPQRSSLSWKNPQELSPHNATLDQSHLGMEHKLRQFQYYVQDPPSSHLLVNDCLMAIHFQTSQSSDTPQLSPHSQTQSDLQQQQQQQQQQLSHTADIRDKIQTLKNMGIKPSVYHYNDLIQALIQDSDYDAVFDVLNELRLLGIRPNAHSYNNALYALHKAGFHQKVHKLFLTMKVEKFKPNIHGYTAAMAAYASMHDWKNTILLLKEMQLSHIDIPIHTYHVALQVCAAVGHWKLAIRIFKDFKSMNPHRLPDNTCYAAVITACARAKQPHFAENVFKDMIQNNLLPTSFTYNSLINAFALVGDWRKTHALIKHMQNRAVHPDNTTLALHIKALALNGHFDKLSLVLQNIQSPTVEIFQNAMLHLAQRGDWKLALDLVALIRSRNIPLNEQIYDALLGAFEKARQYDRCIHLLHELQSGSLGVSPTSTSYGVGIRACRHLGEWVTALAFLKQIEVKQLHHDIEIYNTVLDCLESTKQWTLTIKLFAHIKKLMQPNMQSYSFAFQALANLGNMRESLRLLDELTVRNIEPSTFLLNQVLRVCAKNHRPDLARNLLNKMKTCSVYFPDTNSYTLVIGAYAKIKDYENVIQIYHEMQVLGIRPSVRAYNIYNRALLHQQSTRETSIDLDLPKVLHFDDISVKYMRNIESCAQSGLHHDGLQLMDEMLTKELVPSMITFKTALEMCLLVQDWKRSIKYIAVVKALGEVPTTEMYDLATTCCNKAGRWNEMMRLWDDSKISRGLQDEKCDTYDFAGDMQ